MTDNAELIPNCWEFMECPGKVRDTCPAYPDYGRECWKLTGTICRGGKAAMTTYEEKILSCRNDCQFYKTYLKNIFP